MATNGEGDSQEGYLYLTYLKEYNRPTQIPRRFSKYLEKFNQLCTLILGAYVCNVDLMGGLAHSGQPEDATTPGESWTQQTREESRASSEARQPPLYKRVVNWFAPRRRRSSWRRQLKWGWLTCAIFLVYLALNLILIINIVHLYRYNITRLRLRRVRELTRAHGPEARVAFDNWTLAQQLMAAAGETTANDSTSVLWNRQRTLDLGEFERLLKIKLDQERQLLTWLGDKFINWGIINECMYLNPILLSLCLYLITQWVYLYVNRPDLQLWRDSVDYAGEQRRVDACCESELRKYLESNRIHADLVHEGILALTGSSRKRRQPQAEQQADDLLLERQLLGVQRTSDLRASSLLMQMFTAGALRPLNRCNLWIERRNLAQSALLCNIIVYCLLFDACVLYASYKGSAMTTSPTTTSSPGYRYDLGETCVLVLILLVDCAIIHHFTSLVVACLDQAALVNRILALIYECIHLNEREFRMQRCPSSSSWSWSCAAGGRGTTTTGHAHRPSHDRHASGNKMVDKINSNYLFALLTYKIFVAQLVPFRRTLRNVFLIAFSVSFIVPTLARIHVPYLTDTEQKKEPRELRLTAMLIGAVILLPVNSVCLPLCYLHSRCQKLYKALSSLMAHIAEVRQLSSGGQLCGVNSAAMVYNEHAVNVLAKELANPKQMLEQFVVQSLWGGGTFPTLVKLHFWWGFVALSILIDSPNRGPDTNTWARQHLPKDEFFSSLLGDPLGVWCFHLIQNKQ